MQEKTRKKRKRWWKKLEHWLYVEGVMFSWPIALIIVFRFKDLPIWIQIFLIAFILYGFVFYYRFSSSIGFGRKRIEKADQPVLYTIYYIFWVAVLLFLLFYDFT